MVEDGELRVMRGEVSGEVLHVLKALADADLRNTSVLPFKHI